MSDQEHSLTLPVGTQIGQFRIVSVLGVGGFGIVYKAKHITINKTVAIKEFLPEEIATRVGSDVRPRTTQHIADYEEGLHKFLDEANQLCAFKHSSIVTCTDFIELNDTAYLIMDFYEGKELLEIMNNLQAKGAPLTEFEISEIIVPILEGLKYIHDRDVLHRDIKPGNIFIVAETGKPILIDFGASKKAFSVSDKTQRQALTHGYAPQEQATSLGELGPWTDLHAVGAMMWRIVCVKNPIAVEDRSYEVYQRQQADPMYVELDRHADGFHPGFIALIKKAIALNIKDRFQSADEFIHALKHYKSELKSGGPSPGVKESGGNGPSGGTVTTGTSGVKGGNISGGGSAIDPHGGEEPAGAFSFKTPVLALMAVVILVGGYFAIDYLSNQGSNELESAVREENRRSEVFILMDTFNMRVEEATNHDEAIRSETDYIQLLRLSCDLNSDDACSANISQGESNLNSRKAEKLEALTQAKTEALALLDIYKLDPEMTASFMSEKIAEELSMNRNAKVAKLEIMKSMIENASDLTSVNEVADYIDSVLGQE